AVALNFVGEELRSPHEPEPDVEISSLTAASSAGITRVQGYRWPDNNPPPFSIADGNWGLKAEGVPAAWNLLDTARLKRPRFETAVLDRGFDNLPDLRLPSVEPAFQRLLFCPVSPTPHGNHVAGIVGARFDNSDPADPTRSRGVSGVNPLAAI